MDPIGYEQFQHYFKWSARSKWESILPIAYAGTRLMFTIASSTQVIEYCTQAAVTDVLLKYEQMGGPYGDDELVHVITGSRLAYLVTENLMPKYAPKQVSTLPGEHQQQSTMDEVIAAQQVMANASAVVDGGQPIGQVKSWSNMLRHHHLLKQMHAIRPLKKVYVNGLNMLIVTANNGAFQVVNGTVIRGLPIFDLDDGFEGDETGAYDHFPFARSDLEEWKKCEDPMVTTVLKSHL